MYLIVRPSPRASTIRVISSNRPVVNMASRAIETNKDIKTSRANNVAIYGRVGF